LTEFEAIIVEGPQKLQLKPIGVIHSPYRDGAHAPNQGSGREETCQVEVFREFEEGLKDIEGFSHIILIYYLHKSKAYNLTVKTHWNTKPHGLFTTRSPNRPCPLGLSVVRLVARKENILEVKELDAIDGTPLLDIKPYFPSIDEKADAKVGWFEGKLEIKGET